MQLLRLFWGYGLGLRVPFCRVLPEASAHFAEASWRESQGKGGVDSWKVTAQEN